MHRNWVEMFRTEFGPAKPTNFLNAPFRAIQFPKGGDYFFKQFHTLQKSYFPRTDCEFKERSDLALIIILAYPLSGYTKSSLYKEVLFYLFSKWQDFSKFYDGIICEKIAPIYPVSKNCRKPRVWFRTSIMNSLCSTVILRLQSVLLCLSLNLLWKLGNTSNPKAKLMTSAASQ